MKDDGANEILNFYDLCSSNLYHEPEPEILPDQHKVLEKLQDEQKLNEYLVKIINAQRQLIQVLEQQIKDLAK